MTHVVPQPLPPVLTKRVMEAALKVGAINAIEVARSMRGIPPRERPPGLVEAYSQLKKAKEDAQSGKITASEFIRKHPLHSASELQKLGSKIGIKFSRNTVYFARGQNGVKSRRPRESDPKQAPESVSPRSFSTAERQFLQLATHFGLNRAREILDGIEAILRQREAELIEGQ